MKRRPFQGVWNIVRFNWPFYILAIGGLLLLFAARTDFGAFAIAIDVLLFILIGSTLLSLFVSFYVYDLSGFYELRWLDGLDDKPAGRIANINAGFDETSGLLKEHFKNADLAVCDFYEPSRHTEGSIKRARKSYPPFPGTQNVSTDKLPFETASMEKVFAIMSAHEIRDADERRIFFAEVNRVLADGGQAIVVEHLRDPANLLAYNVGAFHFCTRAAWLDTFKAAELHIIEEKKITPFLTAFILSKNGTEY
jgi:SAM-dependent methyltransferase